MAHVAAQPNVEKFAEQQDKQEQQYERPFAKGKPRTPVAKTRDRQRERAGSHRARRDLLPARADARARILQQRIAQRNAVCEQQRRKIPEKQAVKAAEVDADRKAGRRRKEDGKQPKPV